jgi:hypothetical protein
MPPFGPIKRKDLIRHLKQAGFEGPYSGGKHQFMIRGDITLYTWVAHSVAASSIDTSPKRKF